MINVSCLHSVEASSFLFDNAKVATLRHLSKSHYTTPATTPTPTL